MGNGFAQAGSALGQAFFGQQPDTQPQAMDAAARTAYAWRRAQMQREQQLGLHNLGQKLESAGVPPDQASAIEAYAQAHVNPAEGGKYQSLQQIMGERGYLFNKSQDPNYPLALQNRGVGVMSNKFDYPNAFGGFGETYSKETGKVEPGPLTQHFVSKLDAQTAAEKALAAQRNTKKEGGDKGLTAYQKRELDQHLYLQQSKDPAVQLPPFQIWEKAFNAPYKSVQEVKDAYQAGKIQREDAARILQYKFGIAPDTAQ